MINIAKVYLKKHAPWKLFIRNACQSLCSSRQNLWVQLRFRFIQGFRYTKRCGAPAPHLFAFSLPPGEPVMPVLHRPEPAVYFILQVRSDRKYFLFSYKLHSPDPSLHCRIQRNYVQEAPSVHRHLPDTSA